MAGFRYKNLIKCIEQKGRLNEGLLPDFDMLKKNQRFCRKTNSDTISNPLSLGENQRFYTVLYCNEKQSRSAGIDQNDITISTEKNPPRIGLLKMASLPVQ